MNQFTVTKKHILFVQPELEGVGGVQKVVPVIAKEFELLGYRVSAFTAYGNVSDNGVNWFFKHSLHERLSSNIFHKVSKIIRRARGLIKSLKKCRPDIVIVSTTGIGVLTLFLRKLGFIKLPVLVYVHESISLSGTGQKLLIKKLYPTADGIICVSLGIKNEIKDFLNIPEDKVTLAYNSLPRSVLDVEMKKDKAGLDFLYITASRLEYVKGVDILVDFFIRFFSSSGGHLLVMGTGSLRGQLEKKVIKANLQKRIIFEGYTEEVYKKISEADVYVSCARSESFGLSLVESLAVGIPMVACDVPYGPREILEAECDDYPCKTKYGYLIGSSETTDKEKLYDQFSRVLQLIKKEKFDSNEMRQRAKFFSPESQVKAIEKMLQRCLT